MQVLCRQRWLPPFLLPHSTLTALALYTIGRSTLNSQDVFEVSRCLFCQSEAEND
jgi:hypothetical protein